MINVVFHVTPLILGVGYGAGTLTAIIIFIPLCAWMIYTSFGAGRMSYRALALLVGAGVLFHALLTIPMILLLQGAISETSVVMIQVANPFVLMVILSAAERSRLSMPARQRRPSASR